MKRKLFVATIWALSICLIGGCGGASTNSGQSIVETSSLETVAEETTTEEAENVTDEVIDLELIGTRWKYDDSEAYYYFEADGKLTVELVSESTTTRTSNGSTSTYTSKSLSTQTFTWSREGNIVTVNDSFQLTITQEGDVYKLVGEKISLTYTDKEPLDDDETEEVPVALDAEPYALNDTITTDTIEMTFTEMGVAEDIRITSDESGLSITSGPDPQSGKKFIYIKGTVKNLSTSAVWIGLAGKFTIDGYTFDMNVHTANSLGHPISNIEPLDEFTIILYAPVSNELIDNYNEAVLTFGFNDNFDTVWSLEEAEHTYIVSF